MGSLLRGVASAFDVSSDGGSGDYINTCPGILQRLASVRGDPFGKYCIFFCYLNLVVLGGHLVHRTSPLWGHTQHYPLTRNATHMLSCFLCQRQCYYLPEREGVVCVVECGAL